MRTDNKGVHSPRVNFSLRKEVFFITVGSLVGGMTMVAPATFSSLIFDTRNHFWLAAASIVNSDSVAAGVALHFFVATVIGIATGVVLYKTNMLNVSKILNGLVFGIFSGTVVFLVFAIPVGQLVLGPSIGRIVAELGSDLVETADRNPALILADSFVNHIIWGVTLGMIASLLTAKLGAHYRCHRCDVEFSRITTYYHHARYVHESTHPDMKRVLILGGGYSGVGVLRRIQDRFEKDVKVDITLVSEDNYFLHTPMLPEMATGMIEPRHIATPIRNFCKRAKFYQAKVISVDMDRRSVLIQRMYDRSQKTLEYDYLVLAMGTKTNFFGKENVQKHAFTIKTLADAIMIRNHVITMLEEADQETDPDRQAEFMTFVVVGGGFSGTEVIGELNDFVREAVERFYRNIEHDRIKMILVESEDSILPEIGVLGQYAMQSLSKAGVTILTKTRLEDAGKGYVILGNGTKIRCGTLIWAAGNSVDSVIAELDTLHDKSGRVIVDEFLRLPDHPEVYALGDCASATDRQTQKPYPQTAQHAVRQAKTVASNLGSSISGHGQLSPFEYNSMGTMAKIGARNGVALIMGVRLAGVSAWFVWKQYYLSTLPLTEKRLRVGIDWFIALFFPRDITRLSLPT